MLTCPAIMDPLIREGVLRRANLSILLFVLGLA
jgi:hypothetical protein